MKILGKILLIIFSALLIFALGTLIYYYAVTATTSLDSSKLKLVQNNITLLDKDENLVSECSASGENGVKVKNLPAYTVNAFLCAEDKGFFTHNGLDYKRMAMAGWKNLTSLSFKEGASTISQQLIKNTQLSSEKTIKRKLKEIKLTRQLEKKYSKEQILEAYLNTIYFGHSCFGLESAATFYFNRKAENLSLSQSAILAGMIKSPNNYSPLKNAQNCQKRRNFLLSVMQKNGYISTKERLNAEAEPLPVEGHEKDGFAKDYINAVFAEAGNFIDGKVYEGLNIYTYLDVELQKTLEKQALDQKLGDTDKNFCVINNSDCGIKAFYSTVGNAKRLPGSTIKPLLVYAPALQENVISPATPILDEKIDYAGYSPRNYDGKYHGYVSAREALSNSYNTPAVKLLNVLGVKKGINYLKKMNLTVEEDDASLALALGGMKKGFALKDLVCAYATFTNEGYFNECAFIKKITTANGEVLYEKNGQRKKVFDEDTVTLLNDMLMTAAKTGTAKKMKNLDYEVCAKTGTCGCESGNTDAYCIAYTSSDTVGVWLGRADNSPVKNLTGGGLSTDINLNIQEYLYKNALPSNLKKSANVIRCRLDKSEYEKNHALVLCDDNAPIQEKTLYELFKKDNRPRKSSNYFSRPSLNKIDVFCDEKGILLELCQAEYLTIVINREENGNFKTVYQGKCVEKFLDEEVKEGETYIYSVTPYYKEFGGDTVILPKIKYTKKDSVKKDDDRVENSYIPKDWWR